MIYFLAISTLVSIIGLLAASVAQDFGMTFFGYALFLFGVGFGFFLVKRHFDAAEEARH